MKIIAFALAFYSIFLRLFELKISQKNQEKLKKESYKLTENKLVFQAMLVVHTLFFISLFIELSSSALYFPYLQYLALAIFLLSQLLRYWTLSTLGKNWNVNIMSPENFENSNIVAIGPYRYIRHPNYLVVILELLSLPLIGSAIFTAVIFSFFNAFVLYFRITEEEIFLFKRPKYRTEMLLKKRFIPGVF